MMTPKIDKGRMRVSLTISKKTYAVQVSHIVHEAFHGAVPDGHEVDHINREPMDNHFSNLRIADRSQSLVNKGALTQSGYIGVHRCKSGWETVVLYRGGKLGQRTSKDPIRCALYHDLVSRRECGEFTCLNFPAGLPEGYTERDAFRPDLEEGTELPLFGVTRAKRRFRAHAMKEGQKLIDLYFDIALEAAKARDAAVLPFVGGKTKLNLSVGEHIGAYDTEEELVAAVNAALSRK